MKLKFRSSQRLWQIPLLPAEAIHLLANEGQQPDSPLGPQGHPASSSPVTLGNALESGPAEGHSDLAKVLEMNNTLIQSIRNGYPDNPIFHLVLAKPEQYTKSFIIHDSLIWTTNLKGT